MADGITFSQKAHTHTHTSEIARERERESKALGRCSG